MSWCWCDVIQNYIIFAPKCFHFKIILELNIFENTVVSRVFTFTFCCAVPQRAPIGKIRRPSVKDTEATNVYWWDSIAAIPPNIAIPTNSSTTFQTGNMCQYYVYDSRWVCRNSILRVLPKINTCLFTTFWPSKEKSQSLYPCLSKEALDWLVWMIISSEHALLIASSSDSIVM